MAKAGSQPGKPARSAALAALLQVTRDGQSLATARERVYAALEDARARAFAMQLVQGVLRWRWKLEAMLAACLDKPLRNKEHELRLILAIAAYEIVELSTPDYAVVDEAARLARGQRKAWAVKLVNAVLRKLLREQRAIADGLDEAARLSHPAWLAGRIRADWPRHWRTILDGNNRIPQTHLRVNRRLCTSDALAAALAAEAVACRRHPLDADILVLDSTNVVALPGFDAGWFSVQDAGAQLAAGLLPVSPGQRVLDLCAAPGGKACHLLERCDDDLDLLAVDIDAGRLQRISGNLARLRLHAGLLQADAAADGWYRGKPFDHILLDAPCSATGVIRRHPDIKSLRQPQDVDALVELQARILACAWPLLKPGGSLLYVTCSVLDAENSAQVAGFLAAHPDALESRIETAAGEHCEHGIQLLPGEHDTDGFYFARLHKPA